MTTKSNKDRQQVNYNKPVGIKDGSIYFLNYVFFLNPKKKRIYKTNT